jgi:hypothetical protein
MFGLPEALMSFIRRQVGLRTDQASATGSLHAKIVDLKEFAGTLQKPRGLVFGSFGTGSTSYVTALDIQGNGILHLISAQSVDGYDYGNLCIKVTVDGVVISEGQVAASNDKSPSNGILAYPSIGWYKVAADNNIYVTSNYLTLLNVDFKSSLKIEAKNMFNRGTLYCYWRYSI